MRFWYLLVLVALVIGNTDTTILIDWYRHCSSFFAASAGTYVPR